MDAVWIGLDWNAFGIVWMRLEFGSLFLTICVLKIRICFGFRASDFEFQKRNSILNKDLHKNYAFATDDL